MKSHLVHCREIFFFSFFYHNKLNGSVPRSIFKLENNTGMNLSCKNLSGIVEGNIFSNMKELKNLDLSHVLSHLAVQAMWIICYPNLVHWFFLHALYKWLSLLFETLQTVRTFRPFQTCLKESFQFHPHIQFYFMFLINN